MGENFVHFFELYRNKSIVGMVSLIGSISHWKENNISFKTAALFAPTAMLGAYLGARLTALPIVTDTFQLVCFGIIMAIASILMIRKGNKKTSVQNINFKQSASLVPKHIPQWLVIALEALVVGVITGFVGVGGGFLIIPALVLLSGIPMKKAIGTSLLIIFSKSVTGFLGYATQLTLNWHLIASFTVAASLGTILGAYLTKFIDAKYLQQSFGYFVLAVAIFILIKR